MFCCRRASVAAAAVGSAIKCRQHGVWHVSLLALEDCVWCHRHVCRLRETKSRDSWRHAHRRLGCGTQQETILDKRFQHCVGSAAHLRKTVLEISTNNRKNRCMFNSLRLQEFAVYHRSYVTIQLVCYSKNSEREFRSYQNFSMTITTWNSAYAANIS